ncbi:hypothetical protein K438DRAFT_1475158, partial [Mycena galopus ATCC 62051]
GSGSQRFCQSGAAAEIVELLEGLKARLDLMGVPAPEMVTVDNCCTVGNKIRTVFELIKVLLDVHHFIMRYGAGILGGAQNPRRAEILKDIRDAILKAPASKDSLAQYWSQAEQETRLAAAYDKWAQRGVWSAAATNIHAAQIQHVRKGCLARPREDIASDGSQIEGSHKGWNGIQRSFASGLEMQTALGHDFVLRRNIRTGLDGKYKSSDTFLKSTFGSHHIALVDHTAATWNDLIHALGDPYLPLPQLRDVSSGEKFGLPRSTHRRNAVTDSFGGLFTIKQEPELDGDEVQQLDPEQQEELLRELNLDPALFLRPLPGPTPTADGAPIIQRALANEASAAHEHEHSSKTSTSARHLDSVPPLEELTASLPIPQTSTNSLKSTRSEKFFAKCTGTNTQSLAIQTGPEWFLFMELRKKLQWRVIDMTPPKWVHAATECNARLKLEFPGAVPKNPRALINELGGIETKITQRLTNNNFVCKPVSF